MRPDQAALRLDLAGRLAAGGQKMGVQGVVLAWGGLPPVGPVPDGVTLVALPPAWALDEAPETMLDADGNRADWAWKKRRAAVLLGLFAGMRPRLIVLDGAPTLFRFELRPLLEMARRRPDPPRIGLWPAGAAVGPDLAPLLMDAVQVDGMPDGSAAAMAAL